MHGQPHVRFKSYGVCLCKCYSRIFRYITSSHSSTFLNLTKREGDSLHVKKEFGWHKGMAELILISVVNECNRIASRPITPHHAQSRPITPHHAPSRPITPHHAPSRPGRLNVVATVSATHFRRDETNMGRGMEYVETCGTTHA